MGEWVQDKVADVITDTVSHMVNENTTKVNAVVEALTFLEDAFSGAVVQLRWALEKKEESE